MATKTRDFASAGASAAMRDRAAAKGGLHLVKTISRASESARDKRRYDPRRDEREPAPRPDNGELVSATPEQRAYETVNYVLRTLGNRLGAAGLVSLPALDRALTSATAAVLFSAEASPLFESLRAQAHDLVLVNSVFCAIYFVGFLTARLAGTIPKYDTKKSGELAMKIIEEMFHAAIGEEATKGNHKANTTAYKTLRTATGLLRPTDSGPGIFPGFPKFEPSSYSNDGFFKVRTYLKDFDDLVDHFGRNGFPQPVVRNEKESGKRPEERSQIKDWKFLTGDENTRNFDVSHADRHVGENFGRVIYWLVCSAHRLQPGQAVIVYHQQHIQLVRWLGNRFGYRVLSAATDLSWTGKHWELSDRLKSVVREWLIIVPAPKRKSEKRLSRMTVRTMDSETSTVTLPSSPRSPTQQTINEQAETWNLQQKSVQANSKEFRRPVRAGRSVSFATDASGEPINRIISNSSASESPGRAPLRSALKPASNSPPRPPRPEDKDIPDMKEMGQGLGNDNRKSLSPASPAPLTMGDVPDTDPNHFLSGSPTKPLSPGLPPFVSDMSNKRSSSDSMRSSRRQSQSAAGIDRSALQSLSQQSTGTNDTAILDGPPEGATLAADELSGYPAAVYAMHQEDPRQPPDLLHRANPPMIPVKSPRRTSKPSTPEEEKAPTDVSGIDLNMAPAASSSKEGFPNLPVGLVSPTMGGTATPWEAKADVGAYSGLSDSLKDASAQNRPGDEPTYFPSTVQRSLEPPGVSSTDSEDPSRPSSFVAASTASTSSVAPSWPSSIASVPSSVPDTPTVLRSGSVSSTAASSTQPARSNTSSSRRKAPPPPKKVVYATVLYEFDPQDPAEEIPIREGAFVEVIERTHELEQDGWCRVKAGDLVGLVPVAYLEIEPAVMLSTGGPITTASKGTGAETVSLRSGIGHLTAANRGHPTSELGNDSSAHFDPQFSSWTDLDADEFDAEDFAIDATGAPLVRLSSTSAALSDFGSNTSASNFHSRQNSTSTISTATAGPLGVGHSRTSSVIRARIWNTQNDFFTGLSDTRPQSSGTPSSQASSVAWSAVPEPLVLRQLLERKALAMQASQRKEEEEADDQARTPRQEGGKRQRGDYFETASQASSVSTSRRSTVRAGRKKGENKLKGKEKESPTVASPAPRFWDDVSGAVGMVPQPAQDAINEGDEGGEGGGSEAPGQGEDVDDADAPSRIIYDEPEAGSDGDATPTKSEPHAPPRFWDNISGAVSGKTAGMITFSRDDHSVDHGKPGKGTANTSSGDVHGTLLYETLEDGDESGKIIEMRDDDGDDAINIGGDTDGSEEPKGSSAELPSASGSVPSSAPAVVGTGTQAETPESIPEGLASDSRPVGSASHSTSAEAAEPAEPAGWRGSAQPRFWDDVSGGIGHASTSDSGCRQS